MLGRLVVSAALVLSALGAGACATAPADKTASETAAGVARASAFESWAGGNGTGAFFKAIGPGGGSGVR